LAGDPELWSAIDMLGTHQYDSQKATPWPSDVTDKKPVWMTEMSGRKWWPEQGPSNHIENGVAVAKWIHDALTVGEASAWLWAGYRSVLDDNGGLVAPDGSPTKRKWTLGNYSKFVRPGYKRVQVQGNAPAALLVSAFKDSQGNLAVVVINEGSAEISLPFSIAGGTAPTALTPYVTSQTDDLAEQTRLLVADGYFTATFPALSVTTLSGRH
ncbi:MAG TPA: glycoside hydrolase family 30 beta sandwich domain-containing protein, partial [Polyangiaceae bacterium]|nr:glycoside hydrolase family 30 beta sandwich domain-containing protein [Polyangiaceae bacterium]